MQICRDLFRDDAGAVLSAEIVLFGTIGVLGTAVGLSAFAKSINEELFDLAAAFRGLDQSYAVAGFCAETAWTAGSCFLEPRDACPPGAVVVPADEAGRARVTDDSNLNEKARDEEAAPR